MIHDKPSINIMRAVKFARVADCMMYPQYYMISLSHKLKKINDLKY